mgnify:CR=1 FL=1
MVTAIIIFPNNTKQYIEIDSGTLDKKYNHMHSWRLRNKSVITLYSLNDEINEESNIHKLELPPPIDNEMYYGPIIVTLTDNEKKLVSISKNQWKKYYEDMFGGFYSLESSESESESDDSEIDSESEFTNDGYLIDGFVVE